MARQGLEQRWVPILGVFELLGGFLGLGGTISFASTGHSEFNLLVPLLAAAVSLLSITAGSLLLKQRLMGVRLSLFVQLAQVVSFNGFWRYVYLAGPRIMLIIASGGAGLQVGGGGEFILTTHVPDGTLGGIGITGDVSFGFMPTPLEQSRWALGLNLVAVYFAARLWAIWNDLKSPAATTQQPAPEG